MLSNDDISLMRDLAEETLEESCSIFQPVKTADGHGTATVVETLRSTTICRIESKSDDIRTVGGKISLAEKTMVYLPAETTVEPLDIIVVGSERFIVIDFQRTLYEVLREVEVRKE